MSKKITVIGENRQIKRTVALTLVCGQVYDWHVYMSSVKRRPVSEQKAMKRRQLAPTWCRNGYEHHLEPKIERLTASNSEWLAYMQGLEHVSS